MSQDDGPGTLADGAGESRERAGGRTRVTGAVVAKVAARAAGHVHASGTAVRGAHGVDVRGRGPVDIDLLVRSGPSDPDLAGAVRDNVVTEVAHMCGLDAAEVNITVDDVRVCGDYPEEPHVR